MEGPLLPPLPPGRSALPAFLEAERRLRDEAARAEARAAASLEVAREEADRLRVRCEQGLKQRVLDAERQSVKAVEARTRDRVSEARARVQRWIDEAEKAGAQVVAQALDLLAGADADEGGPT